MDPFGCIGIPGGDPMRININNHGGDGKKRKRIDLSVKGGVYFNCKIDPIVKFSTQLKVGL